MAMTQSTLRIHAAVGFARVGNSAEYYIEPQTSAAQPDTGEDGGTTGGLPVVPDTQSRTLRASDLRDSDYRFKRQAVRFKIFAHSLDGPEKYPMRVEPWEIKLGAQVDGKTVADIVWIVHVANKKASWY